METHHEMSPTERTEYYLEKIFWPFVVALIAILLYPFTTSAEWLVPTIYAALGIAIAGRTTNQKLTWQNAAVVGAICGALIAFCFSVELLILDFTVVKMFGSIPRIAVSSAGTALAAGLFTEILYISRKTQARINKNRNAAVKREQQEEQ